MIKFILSANIKLVVFSIFSSILINCAGQPQLDSTQTKYADSIDVSKYKPIGWVNDFDQIFSTIEKLKLDSIIQQFEKETTIEIALVTLDTTEFKKKDFENFTLTLARKWGIGKKGKNNGILIAIVLGYGKIRIHNANGIVKYLSDAQTDAMLKKYLIPEFKKGNYYLGTLNLLEAMMQELRAAFK